jgi:hypothetical protein
LSAAINYQETVVSTGRCGGAIRLHEDSSLLVILLLAIMDEADCAAGIYYPPPL